jgi:asparagine synthase (glutamine-hydrolysing)
MCGIAGIVQREAPAAGLTEKLRQLQAALRHRGPDDAGIYLSPDGCAGLAHTRLAILDLSPAGHQPMASPDGRFQITFNGEIYNFRELREELAAAGEKFSTGTDTEVLLRLYLREGADCLPKLAGMFAFAVWDDLEKSCFLACGPLGVKQVYFSATPERLVFASELRALIEADLTSRRLCRTALQGYLLFGSVQEPDTLIEGVRKLPAGSWLRWHNGRVTERRYFDVQFALDPPPDENPVATVRAALEESVRRHFVSDVPVGVFLSGGIDSTALVALARRVGVEKLRTFSISFENPELNEGDVAAQTARHFGTEHHDWRFGPADGRRLLAGFVNRMDQPSVDGFNTFCVSKWAHDCGAKVVLSGLGGDEFFGGYPSFQRVPKLAELSRWLTLFSATRRLSGNLLQKFSRVPRNQRLGSFLAGESGLGAAYWTARGIFTPAEAGRLLEKYLPGETPNRDAEQIHFSVPAQPTPEDMVSYLEITRYMRNQLLRDSDVMSMAWGLELRVPFVDARLTRTLAAIPAAIRLQPGKKLLLDAVPEIPRWVAERPKQGFTFPFAQWLRDDWRDVFARLAADSPVPLQNWSRQWSLFALEQFLNRHRIDADRLVGQPWLSPHE